MNAPDGLVSVGNEYKEEGETFWVHKKKEVWI